MPLALPNPRGCDTHAHTHKHTCTYTHTQMHARKHTRIHTKTFCQSIVIAHRTVAYFRAARTKWALVTERSGFADLSTSRVLRVSVELFLALSAAASLPASKTALRSAGSSSRTLARESDVVRVPATHGGGEDGASHSRDPADMCTCLSVCCKGICGSACA